MYKLVLQPAPKPTQDNSELHIHKSGQMTRREPITYNPIGIFRNQKERRNLGGRKELKHLQVRLDGLNKVTKFLTNSSFCCLLHCYC